MIIKACFTASIVACASAPVASLSAYSKVRCFVASAIAMARAACSAINVAICFAIVSIWPVRASISTVNLSSCVVPSPSQFVVLQLLITPCLVICLCNSLFLQSRDKDLIIKVTLAKGFAAMSAANLESGAEDTELARFRR